MKNPFKVGDKAYHARFGLVEISAIYNPVCLKAMVDGKLESLSIELLSFSPWPKPDWERPKSAFVPVLLAGMRVQARGTDNDLATFTIVVKSEEEAFVTSVGGGLYLKGAYTFHRIDEEPVKFN